MHEWLSIAGGAIFPVTYVIYIVAMVRSAGTEHPVQPRRLTWLGYLMLNGVALFTMSVQGKANPSSWMALVGSLSIFLASLRYGLPRIEKVDLVCIAGALLGVLLLVFTRQQGR